MKLRVTLGTDHDGFTIKNELYARLRETYEILDLATRNFEPTDDYPDFLRAVAWTVTSSQAERGILICGKGVGTCIAANKVLGVRASLCHDTNSAQQGEEHDDMNNLCLGERVIGVELATGLAIIFLNVSFSGEERHQHRLEKVSAIERQVLQKK